MNFLLQITNVDADVVQCTLTSSYDYSPTSIAAWYDKIHL